MMQINLQPAGRPFSTTFFEQHHLSTWYGGSYIDFLESWRSLTFCNTGHGQFSHIGSGHSIYASEQLVAAIIATSKSLAAALTKFLNRSCLDFFRLPSEGRVKSCFLLIEPATYGNWPFLVTPSEQLTKPIFGISLSRQMATLWTQWTLCSDCRLPRQIARTFHCDTGTPDKTITRA